KEGPPQDSDIHQLIEECSVEVSEEQKQSMKDTMLELVKICRQKELLCIHDNVDDLIESALNSKLLSINSQRPDKKEQEAKNVVEQPVERGNCSIESLQNFRVIRKSSTFLKDTSQISLVHAIAPILLIEEPEHSLSMRYEHLSTTPETESDEVTESSAKNLLPIPSECEVTSEDENNDDITSSDDESLPEEDVSAKEFKIYSNPLFDEDEINSDKLDPHCFNVKYDFVESLLNRDTFIDSSSQFDFSEIDIVTNTDVLPLGVENDDDSEGEIDVVNDLHADNSISNFEHELSEDEESDFDDPSFPRPPLEPPDAEFNFKPDAENEIPVVMNDKDEFDDDYFPFIVRTLSLTLVSPFRSSGISLGWNFHDLPLID
nr:hypothetical protein [Tanacetum cinerariifolium]